MQCPGSNGQDSRMAEAVSVGWGGANGGRAKMHTKSQKNRTPNPTRPRTPSAQVSVCVCICVPANIEVGPVGAEVLAGGWLGRWGSGQGSQVALIINSNSISNSSRGRRSSNNNNNNNEQVQFAAYVPMCAYVRYLCVAFDIYFMYSSHVMR